MILNKFPFGFHKAVFRLILFFAAVVFALVLCEIILRIAEEKKYELLDCYSLDAKRHHVMLAGNTCRFKTKEWDVTYKFNSFGMRGDEINKEKRNGVFRVLILGDSTWQGYGVEEKDSFARLLSEKLNGKQGLEGFGVINAAVFGYSPLLQYLYLKNEGLSFDPDLVVMSFDATEFWEDRQRFSELRKSYPGFGDEEIKKLVAEGNVEFKFDLINRAGNSPSKVSPLDERVYLLKNWLKSHVRVYKVLADYMDRRKQPTQQDVLYQGDLDRDIVAIYRGERIAQEKWEELWKLPLYHLKLISEMLDENNVAFMIVGIPGAVQVSDEEWPNRIALGFEKHFVDPRGPFQNELKKRLVGMNIDFVDLLPGFRESGIFPLFFSMDGHFNQNGHRLAAEIAFPEILKYAKSRMDKRL